MNNYSLPVSYVLRLFLIIEQFDCRIRRTLQSYLNNTKRILQKTKEIIGDIEYKRQTAFNEPLTGRIVQISLIALLLFLMIMVSIPERIEISETPDKSPLYAGISEELYDTGTALFVAEVNLKKAKRAQTALAYRTLENKINETVEEYRQLEESIAYYASLPENVPNWESGCISSKKTYMDYRKVTTQSSIQYKVLNSPNAYTDEMSGIRMVDGRYCMAIGQGYGLSAGDKFTAVMENGNIISCIVGDMKADIDTDASMKYQATDGSVLEFIVDKNYFTSPSQYPKEFDGRVIKIVKDFDYGSN